MAVCRNIEALIHPRSEGRVNLLFTYAKQGRKDEAARFSPIHWQNKGGVVILATKTIVMTAAATARGGQLD